MRPGSNGGENATVALASISVDLGVECRIRLNVRALERKHTVFAAEKLEWGDVNVDA